MSESAGKFNDNIQIFSPEQVDRIFDELKIKPAPPKPQVKPEIKPQPAPEQSVEDILKNNFIDEEPV